MMTERSSEDLDVLLGGGPERFARRLMLAELLGPAPGLYRGPERHQPRRGLGPLGLPLALRPQKRR
ncbi:MAG: hypothetical protein ACE366_13145 [Bradymonadia bacterium]